VDAARASLERRDDGALHIAGPLVFATVQAVLERSRSLLPSAGTAVFDFSAVAQTDSAALALIVEWRKLARQRGLALELRGLPQQLRALAVASGLEALCA
jgi:phospholipid transport system transporter-binding protein